MQRRKAVKTLGMISAGSLISHHLISDCITTDDIEGPFYIAGLTATAQLAPNGAPGTKLFMTGTVYANDCITPIKNALVDVWHANDAGEYEGTNYRGKVLTDDGGNYAYETIWPGKYLNGASFRPRHIHYKVNAPGESILTTQIYFEGDTDIPGDFWASDPKAEDRIITLSTDGSSHLHGVADIFLDVDPSTITGFNGVQPKYNRSVISHINPSTNSLSIFLKQGGKVEICMYDVFGKLQGVVLHDTDLRSGNHQFVINNYHLISRGIYILRMRYNGKPIDAKRVMLK